MSGRATSQPTLTSSATMPVRMNRSGSVIEGAVAASNRAPLAFPDGARGTAGRLRGFRSTAADMGKVASIALLLGFPHETTRFQHRIKVNRPPVRARAQRRARRQRSERLEDLHHRLRWFEAARIEVHDFA